MANSATTYLLILCTESLVWLYGAYPSLEEAKKMKAIADYGEQMVIVEATRGKKKIVVGEDWQHSSLVLPSFY